MAEGRERLQDHGNKSVYTLPCTAIQYQVVDLPLVLIEINIFDFKFCIELRNQLGLATNLPSIKSSCALTAISLYFYICMRNTKNYVFYHNFLTLCLPPCQSSTEPVLAAEFHPCENTSIVTCGKNQISFWTLEGGTLTRKLGLYEVCSKCVEYSQT